MKQLFRSQTNRKIAGVCGGIAEMVEADPVVVRLITVLLALITGVVPFVIGYIIAWVIVPERSGFNPSGPVNRN